MGLGLAALWSQKSVTTTTSKITVVHTSDDRVQPCVLPGILLKRTLCKHEHVGDPSLDGYEDIGL